MSRWSRPITIGAATAPLATRSLNARPARWRSPWPSQQMRAGRPWNWTFSAAIFIQRAQRLVLREQVEHGLVGGGDVGRIARQRGPAERPAALAEQRPDVGGDEAGVVEGALVAAELRLGAQRVAVVEDLGARVLEADHRLDVAGHRLARPLGRARPFARRPPSPRTRPRAARRRAGRGRRSGRSRRRSARPREQLRKTSAQLPSRPIESGVPASRASTARRSASSSRTASTSR